MSQTSYSLEAGLAFEGMLGDAAGGGPTRRSISRANESATASFFGRGVTYGTDPDTQFKLPTATGAALAGVTVHKHGTENVEDNGVAQDETAELLTSGRIWVSPEQAVTPASAVYWRHTAGAGTVGKFRVDADTANADVVANARWLTSCAADGYALLELITP